MSFASLKKNRNATFEKLSKQIADAAKGKTVTQEDDRYWKPTRDKSGNAVAIIRFLPGFEGETSYIKKWDHGFQGPTGKWYIEKSLTTINKPDPVSELNSQLWNSGKESDKDQARVQKRRLKFVSNIYVVNDQANPENNGKVFLYEYGKKIFEKINDAMHPIVDTDEPVNPFDMWEGANFRLIIRTVDKFPNYDKSKFEDPSALSHDDEELEKIYNQQYSLNELIDPSNYPSYEDLKRKLDSVLGGTSPKQTKVSDDDDEDEAEFKSKFSMEETPDEKSPIVSDDDEEDDLDYFKKLAGK